MKNKHSHPRSRYTTVKPFNTPNEIERKIQKRKQQFFAKSIQTGGQIIAFDFIKISNWDNI